MTSNQETSGIVKRPKAEWNEKNNEIFLMICVEQVRAGNRPHAHLTKLGWANVIKKFNEKTGLSYEYKQMKNKWDLLKKEWQMWEKLRGKKTGIGWDHWSRTVTASEEWWEAKIKENPDAAKFKGKGMKNLPEMEILFRDVVASGHGKWAPSKDPQQEIETTAKMCMTKTTENDDVEEMPSSVQKLKRKRSVSDKRGSIGKRICDQFDRVIESLNRDTATTDTAASVPLIGVCLDLLKQLPGLEYNSETHLLGIRLMKSKSNREIFAQLGDPILQLNWIKTHNLVDLSR